MSAIGVIGLGYVGLPLAVELGKKFEVVGFDINEKRVSELKKSFDRTREVDSVDLAQTKVKFSANSDNIKKCDFYIITVPTPITESKQPDLTPLIKASELVGRVLKKGDIVVYESTVYPGCTEEVCVPILEKQSGLIYNTDFSCGYSPERVNPGDKEHTLPKIRKVISASNSKALDAVRNVYASIISAGVFEASSIKVAEAAKVIENTQRDINIAFINELSLIFSRLGLDTKEVLEAASTKWNFLKFSPGLVGGHCIGVDPYYLTHKAEAMGYHPEVILSGRRINDGMGAHVARQTVKALIKKGTVVSKARVLVLGMTFKENCPDVRNSKVIDVIKEFREFDCLVDVYDPHALPDEVEHEYNIKMCSDSVLKNLSLYDAIVVTVAHKEFTRIPWDQVNRVKQVIFDVKGLLSKEESDGRL